MDSFIEEAVVRRELSDNYCFYTPEYDTMAACFDWARDSLNKHRSDEREHVYTRCALLNVCTWKPLSNCPFSGRRSG